MAADSERRRARRDIATSTEAQTATSTSPAIKSKAREAAPVMVYFNGQDHRTLKKIQELLDARGIPHKVLDCTDDEATRSWATAASQGQEFPLVFIAGESVGGLHELTQLDVNKALSRRVFGS